MENVKKATATTTWMVPTAQEGKKGPSALFLPVERFEIRIPEVLSYTG